MENVHSKNDKANMIIYLLGFKCFRAGLDLTRLKRTEYPAILKSCNIVYSIKKDNELIGYYGFEDKRETFYQLDIKEPNATQMSYDATLSKLTGK